MISNGAGGHDNHRLMVQPPGTIQTGTDIAIIKPQEGFLIAFSIENFL
jgi:hypothetical protein